MLAEGQRIDDVSRMVMPAELKLTSQMRWFFRMRFLVGKTQREIAQLLGIAQPAVSRREGRIRHRFIQAGLPEPVAPGRGLVKVSAVSLIDRD